MRHALGFLRINDVGFGWFDSIPPRRPASRSQALAVTKPEEAGLRAVYVPDNLPDRPTTPQRSG